MLPNVQHAPIKPVISETVAAGVLIQADEYDIYGRLPVWATAKRRIVTPRVTMPAMRMAMAFALSTSTPLRASGHGCIRIEISCRASCRCISAVRAKDPSAFKVNPHQLIAGQYTCLRAKIVI